MPRRVRNWKPDIYDLTADRSQAPPELDVRDLAVTGAATSVAEPTTADVVAADVAATTAAADTGEDAVAIQTTLRPPFEPSVRLVRLVPPPPRRENDGLVGLVAGAIVGAALTLLLTPASGEALRARLRGQAETLSNTAANRAEALAQKLPITTASEQNPMPGEQNQ